MKFKVKPGAFSEYLHFSLRYTVPVTHFLLQNFQFWQLGGIVNSVYHQEHVTLLSDKINHLDRKKGKKKFVCNKSMISNDINQQQ